MRINKSKTTPALYTLYHGPLLMFFTSFTKTNNDVLLYSGEEFIGFLDAKESDFMNIYRCACL
jgi:hypothetical protein